MFYSLNIQYVCHIETICGNRVLPKSLLQLDFHKIKNKLYFVFSCCFWFVWMTTSIFIKRNRLCFVERNRMPVFGKRLLSYPAYTTAGRLEVRRLDGSHFLFANSTADTFNAKHGRFSLSLDVRYPLVSERSVTPWVRERGRKRARVCDWSVVR